MEKRSPSSWRWRRREPDLRRVRSPGVSLQPKHEMPLNVAPLRRDDAVLMRVPRRPVSAGHVMAQHSVLLRAEALDRPLGREVEVVGAQADDRAFERLECVREQEQLARRVHVRSLKSRRVPRPADLHAIDRRHDVVVARAADDLAARQRRARPTAACGRRAGRRARCRCTRRPGQARGPTCTRSPIDFRRPPRWRDRHDGPV